MADKTALDMRYLNVPLPEDLMKLKWGGDYERLISVIDRRLADETLPAPLRKRLQLERILAARIPSQYPYSYEDALELLRANIRDFKDEELETLWEENTADWIYINGRVQFHELFFDNLMKTRDDYGARFLGTMEDNEKNAALLRENVRLMEEHGGRTVHMRLLTRLSLTPEAEKACMGKTAHVYMPLPVEYAQVRNLRLLGFEGTAGEPVSVDNGSYPQRTARFETVIRGGEVWQTEFEFDNETVFRNPDPSQVLFSQPSLPQGTDKERDRRRGKSSSGGREDLQVYYLPGQIFLCEKLQHSGGYTGIYGCQQEGRLRLPGAALYHHVQDCRDSGQMAVRPLRYASDCGKPRLGPVLRGAVRMAERGLLLRRIRLPPGR